MKRILHITIALLLLLAAGQNAWAETKTVTYTLSRVKVDHTDYWALTHSGNTPFDGTTTVQQQQETDRTQAMFNLPDGFIFSFDWKGGTVTGVSNSYFFCQNKNVQFGLSWNLTNKYVINVSVTDQNGTASTLSSSGTASTAFTYSEQGDVSYTLGLYAEFAKLVITYCDLWGSIAYGADGTEAKPYRISSKADLDRLASNVNSGVSTYSGIHFRQTDNIGYDSLVVNNFTAIGTSSNPFSGHYDGNKKTISGININKTGTDTNADSYLGIFGYVDGGTIERLALASSAIVGYQYVGGIAGYLKGTVQNCRVEDNVTISKGTNDNKSKYFGGVVGRSYNGNDTFVQGCVCGATVTGKYYVGGIVGDSGGELRSNFYFGTKVTGDADGAILGINNYSYNNYYIASTYVQYAIGQDRTNHHIDVVESDRNASRAKLLTLGEHVAIVGEKVKYDFSGLTDLGGKALIYNDGNSVRIFTHMMQIFEFVYTGSVPEGKSVAFSLYAQGNNGTLLKPIQGTTWDTKTQNNYYNGYDAFSIYATLVSDQLTITAKPGVGGYWTTFYSSAAYNLPEGAVAYAMDSADGQLYPLRTKDDDYKTLYGRGIFGCVAVVIFSDKPSITLTKTEMDRGFLPLSDTNSLQGSDSPVPVENGKVDGKTPYVLGIVNGVFGFHPFTGTEIPANKAYYLK
ncbi:MAG: hypothetical protein IKS47_01980 [Bacteroidales bacterium]|nr:hypothetical protein [Bacteroidales bacterium]